MKTVLAGVSILALIPFIEVTDTCSLKELSPFYLPTCQSLSSGPPLRTKESESTSQSSRIWGFLVLLSSFWLPRALPWLWRRQSMVSKSSAEKWSSSAPWPFLSRTAAARSQRLFQGAPQRTRSAPKESRLPPKVAARCQERSRAPGRSKLSPRSKFLRLLLKRP